MCLYSAVSYSCLGQPCEGVHTLSPLSVAFPGKLVRFLKSDGDFRVRPRGYAHQGG